MFLWIFLKLVKLMLLFFFSEMGYKKKEQFFLE